VKETVKSAIPTHAARWRVPIAVGWTALVVTIASSSVPVGAAAGNATNGQKLYASQGCGSCHKIGGKGGKIGPDLSKEGTKKRSTQWLVAFLKNPKRTNPKSIMPPVTGSPKELQDLAAYMQSLKK
jgi:mono/diheme cytochrome c family protein